MRPSTLRPHRVVLILVLFLLALAGMGRAAMKPRLTLDEVALSDVPEAIVTTQANEGFNNQRPRDVNWHVSQEQNGYWFVACTFTLIGGDGRYDTLYHIWRYDGTPLSAVSPQTGSVGSAKFDALTSEDLANRRLIASGIALDKRIADIQATTSDGQTVNVQPVNGFWTLDATVRDVTQKWIGFTALNADGKALYSIKR